MKKRLWLAGGLVLVAVIVVGIFLLLVPFGGQGNTATVVEAINKVDAHPRPRADWEPAVVDMAIYGGGQVRTGTESSARLELLEGLVRLSADSIFTVKESVTRQGTLLTTLFLQEGRLWVHLTSDQPHEFTVETGNAVAAVRDTHFSVRVADEETLLSVAEGEVELTAQEQSVTVAAEEQATVEPDQPPSPPEPLSAEERRMWTTEGEMPELAPPTLYLRVNYGHDWVESFYEAAGHTVWITVTESDGVTVKATAESVTEPKYFLDGETGFQTQPEDWDPSPPDIQPNDWVYGSVDNGASARVQIGEIKGTVDLEADTIQGTINVPWFSDEVEVECHVWGTTGPEPDLKFDSVLPDGKDLYSCSWAGEWDIQLKQDVGVGYSGPDGHWVAGTFQKYDR